MGGSKEANNVLSCGISARTEPLKPSGDVNGLNVGRDDGSSALNIGKEESLRVRYFRAASLTTKTLVNSLVEILSLTFWAAYGCQTLHSYCRKKLEFRPALMKKVFTPTERKCLKKSPLFEPFGPVLNFKLLKRVFKGLREDVVKQVQALERVPLTACHAPPRLLNRQHLWNHLHRLFRQQRMLRDAVVQFSLKILENKLKVLGEETIKRKRRIGSTFRDLTEAQATLVHVSLDTSILTMESEYQHLTFAENNFDRNFEVRAATNIRAISRMLENLSALETQLMIDLLKTKNVKETVKCTELLYLSIIEENVLLDNLLELNYTSGYRLSLCDLKESYHIFCDLRNVKKDRLEALGRLEVMSHHSSFGRTQIDLSKWLLLRKANTLHVDKIYSFLKRSDTGELESVDQVLEKNIPKIIVVTGPMASGKTCLCQYLFHQWRIGNSSIQFLQRTDLVVCLKAENASYDSFVPYLKIMFSKSLEGLQNSEALSLFRHFKVLFIIDTSLSITDTALKAIKELAVSLGKNKMMVTSRPEKRRLINNALRNEHFQPVTFTMEPLHKALLKEFCHDSLKSIYPFESSKIDDVFRSTAKVDRFLSGRSRLGSTAASSHAQNFGSLNASDHHGESKFSVGTSPDIENVYCRLTEQLVAEERGDGLFYPLPISYMMFLWSENPSKLKKVLSLSDLFEAVLDVSQSKLKTRLTREYAAFENEINTETIRKMKKLFSMASKSIKEETILCNVNDQDLHDGIGEDDLSDVCSEGLFPFLVCSGLRYGQRVDHYHIFLHPCLHEFLLACNVVSSLDSRKSMFFKPNIQHVFPTRAVENVGGKYLDTIRFICGALTMRPNLNASSGEHIVQLFKASGVNDKDYHSWEGLVLVGKCQTSLVKAVSNTLNARMRLKIPVSSHEETGALCRLLRRGIYQPKEVAITSEIPQDLIDTLSSCACADISILPGPGYCGISKERDQDALLNALSKVGNVVELWGRLGVRGASSLCNMTRLHTLHVHISTLGALGALTKSLKTCSSLQELHLRLSLPDTIPAEKVPSLPSPAQTIVYLTLAGITESSWEWAVRLVKQLNCHTLQVHLAQANLSPLRLHDLKKELRPVPVHTSN